MSHDEATKSYEAKRAELAARHDAGAAEALGDCIEVDVECMAYCYGGSPRVDIAETLAELAEQGWRLVRGAAERDALAARVKELEADLHEARAVLRAARRILRGEDDTTGGTDG